MTSNGEHLFKCLLAICTASSARYLVRSFAHFLIEFLVFLLLSCRTSLCIFGYKSILRCVFCKKLPPGCGLSFHFLNSRAEVFGGFLCLFSAVSMACQSSWGGDRSCTTAVTSPDSLPAEPSSNFQKFLILRKSSLLFLFSFLGCAFVLPTWIFFFSVFSCILLS